MEVKFTAREIKALEGHPDALRALADWHSVRATEADSIGPEFSGSVTYHEDRRNELRIEASQIEAGY